MTTVLSLLLAVDDDPDHLARMLIEQPDPNPRSVLTNVAKRLPAYASGVKRAKYRLRIDSSEADGDEALLEAATVTYTITHANVTAAETLVIGGTTLAWAAAAADEDEVTIGANLAEDVANMVAAINAHSALEGIVEASSPSAGVVALTFLGDPRMARHVLLAETGDAGVLSATSFAGDTTDAHIASTDLESLGL